ncbi:L-rhamnose mutarotase [Sphingomonas sp.]|jgi:L-rhamnose mutarotase|uniref:L-rhamnose mutarotase n=1 Tax=Sphingomonas sp. TaxID=28214 RepID=UPI002ED9750A
MSTNPPWIERRCLILDLQNDPTLIAQYEHWHRPGGPPAAVNASIRAAGILQMEIFRSADRLIMIMDVGPGFDPAAKAQADAADPEVQAWERLMNAYQKPVSWARPGEKWVSAPSIYRLSDQPDGGEG